MTISILGGTAFQGREKKMRGHISEPQNILFFMTDSAKRRLPHRRFPRPPAEPQPREHHGCLRHLPDEVVQPAVREGRQHNVAPPAHGKGFVYNE